MYSPRRFAQRAVRHSRSPFFTLLAILALAVGFSLIVNAAAGDLDPSFSTDGKQTTNFFRNFDVASDVALQRNGKIVAVGYATKTGGTSDFALARYNTNGALDTTFSGDGKQTTDFPGNDFGQAVAIQSDGKIVVGGYSINNEGQRNFALARYLSTGGLDTSFSGDGKVKTDFNGARDTITDIAIQSDGKIVVAGGAETAPGSGSYDFAVARYLSNGAPDPTFDGDGKLTTDFFSGFEFANGVALLQDGKILASGRAINPATHTGDFALARYQANGLLDTTFSGDGKQATDFGRTMDSAIGVAVQPDQKIVLVGSSISSTAGYRFALARYLTTGGLDKTFSADGKQITTFPGVFHNAFSYDAVIQSNGKIIAVGNTCDENFLCDLALARYNTNGSLDLSFSGDGKLTVDTGGDDNVYGAALQPDGKIVAAGTFGPSDLASEPYDFQIMRFLGDPAPVTSPSESDSQTEGAHSDSHQISVAPAVPVSDTNKLLNINPGAEKSISRKRLLGLIPGADPTAEFEW